jgi:hypothetical protein
VNSESLAGGWSIPIGAQVDDVEGEHIGKVTAADSFNLTVTSGIVLLVDYEIPLALVGEYADGRLRLTCTKAEATGER